MYRSIPGFPDYEISIKGVLRTVDTKEVIPFHLSNRYEFFSVKDEFGKKTSLGKHRALALAYIPLPDTDEYVEPNHIDNDRSNNDIGNLEWTTRSENTLHAIRTGRARTLQSMVRNKTTGTEQHFFTLTDLASSLNMSVHHLSKIKKGSRFLYIGDLEIEFLIEKYLENRADPFPFGIAARNITTGEVLTAKTAYGLGTAIGICYKVIGRLVKKGLNKYPVKGYEIKIIEPGMQWSLYTDEEVEAFKDEKFIFTPVWVKRDDVNKLFGSIKKAAAFTGTSERAIREVIDKQKPCKNDFIYERYELRSHLTVM